VIKISENAKTPSFEWTNFYMKFADKLLEYKNDRTNLIKLIDKVFDKSNLKNPFMENGELFDDICPFTVFSAFNRQIKMNNRITILKNIKKFLKLMRLFLLNSRALLLYPLYSQDFSQRKVKEKKMTFLTFGIYLKPLLTTLIILLK